MTPQEKAIQLVDNFMDLSEEQEYDTPRYMPKEMAVKCALIAVNEIKTLLYNADRMYWMEVKKEIEKL
jgi:hypothetical protein